MTTTIPGHEGVGKVVKLGPNVNDSLLGRRVGVKWVNSACLKCEICPVDFTACANQHNSGRDVPGTFAQYVIADSRFVSIIPDAVSSEDAAPLLCGNCVPGSHTPSIVLTGQQPD